MWGGYQTGGDEQLGAVSGSGGGSDKIVPSGRGQAELELFLNLSGQASGVEVSTCGPAVVGVEEILAKYGGGPLIDVSQVNLALVIGTGLALGYGDSQLLSQAADGLGETDPIFAHKELKDTSAGAAAKTFEDALGGTDTEGRGFFFVEGTQAEEVSSGPFEGDVLADNLDDIGGVLHLPDRSLVYHCAGTLSLGW